MVYIHLLRNIFGVLLYYGNVKNNTSWYSYLCDTYCCCITGTRTRMYNTQYNTGLKYHGFSVGIEIDLVVVWVVDTDLISVWGIGIDLISV